MKNPIVTLVENELIWFEQVLNEDRSRPEYERIFPKKDNLYPMPFFGDIRRAEVLTLALNPSHTEFDERQWPCNGKPTALTGSALTSRLLHYFDLPEPEPHPFFSQLSQMLLLIHSSYTENAAHIDLSSLPTFMPSRMTPRQRPIFVRSVSAYAARLNEALRLAVAKKLILVVDFRVNDGLGGQISIWQTLLQHCPRIAACTNQHGSALPILKEKSVESLSKLVFDNRYAIREHLLSGATLSLANHD
jgi:hypothetical protein